MNTITTHVLDLSSGIPASHMNVRLERQADYETTWHLVALATTDEDGRVRDWQDAPAPTPGLYRLTFATASHFANAFYPEVSVTFNVPDAAQHYHLPLLISAFGYTTYRGS